MGCLTIHGPALFCGVLRLSHSYLERISLDFAPRLTQREGFPMAKFAVGEVVDKATGDHSCGIVVAVFPTVEGSYGYAIDTEGYGALQFVVEDDLVSHTTH